MNVLAYVVKNMAVWIGVAEAILKAVAAVVSITPTKKDDAFMASVDSVFSQIKKFLYDISDKFAGKL
jgi:hypothetical protein